MKTTRKFVELSILLLLSGCVTYPRKITPEIKQTVKSVSVENEVHVPSTIQRPGGSGGGVVEMVVAEAILSKMDNSFNGKLRAQLNTSEFLSRTLLSTFKAKLASRSLFTLKTNETADASFVLEITRAGFDEIIAWPFPGWGGMPPEITVVVTLIAKPPFELMRDKSGTLTTEDPPKHPILYQKTAYVRRTGKLPFYTKEH